MSREFQAKFLTLLRLLRSSTISIKSPAKSAVVFFGYPSALPMLKDLVDGEPIVVLDPTYKSTIFLPSLAKSVIRWTVTGFSFSITHHYFVSFLKRVKPKLVMTTIDNNKNFYTARRSLSDLDARFVVFQNGNRWISQIPDEPSLQEGDVIFCLTEAYIAPFSHCAGSATTLPAGTLASKLEMPGPSGLKGGGKGGFISNWRPGHLIEGQYWMAQNGSSYLHSLFYQPEISLLKDLMLALNELSIDLEIIGASNHHQSEEYSFYESILGTYGWTYSPKVDGEKSYKKLPRYTALFCVDSTLGYEALSFLHRVMFLDSSAAESTRLPLGYPAHAELASSVLMLRVGEAGVWRSQINNVLKMNSDSFALQAESVVGRMSVQTDYSFMQAIVRNTWRG